ncbi:MAG: hypothetical protein ABI855_18180, partial [Bacteroidota bacterium]
GIGQGGNVIRECLQLAANDSTFVNEKDNNESARKKWTIKSVTYVATPIYKKMHKLDKLPKGCSVLSVYSRLDLTQLAVEYFDPADNLLDLIKKYETNTLSFVVGKIKMRVVKILAIIFGGLNLDVNDMGKTKKQIDDFAGIADEVEGLIKDIISLVTEMISQFEELVNVKSDDLTQFKDAVDNYDKIPELSKNILGDELFNEDDPTKPPGLVQRIKSMATNTNLDLAKADLGRFLNFLNPLLDGLTNSLKTLTGAASLIKSGSHKNDKTVKSSQEQLADKIADSLNGAKIYEIGDNNPGNSIDVTSKDGYYPKIINKIKEEHKADLVFSYISSIQSKLNAASREGEDPTLTTFPAKKSLTEAIAIFAHPLLISKGELIDKLMVPLKGRDFLNKIFEDDMIKTLLGKAAGPLSKFTIKPPHEFLEKQEALDNEIKRIGDFFKKTDYQLQDDTLYFIYNAHNLVINSVPAELVKALCDQTSITENQNGKVWSEDKKDFIAAGKPKDNVQPTASVPEPEPANK